MKAYIMGLEVHLEAESAIEGYDLAEMLKQSKAVGMDAAIDRDSNKNFLRLRIAAKIRSGPKLKTAKGAETVTVTVDTQTGDASSESLSNIGEVLKDKKEFN